ncbi:proteasome regulatory particle subunit [Diplodia corticola]|uniref:Proteasome regulatory particle subunit n=1 Tax=Diplodia corticola TaxID=236234 RepID=A0A1J9QRD3_9PEZI|nr:proteasome regulatory particle subunit [Diplodia corticola]OJD30570.1 proteasome regulatory particle subunit [Diplodia corticola]
MNRAFFSFPRTFEQPVCAGWDRSFAVPDVSARLKAGAKSPQAPSAAPAPGAHQHHHRQRRPQLPPTHHPLPPPPNTATPAAPSPSRPEPPAAVSASAQSPPPPEPSSSAAPPQPPSASTHAMADKELQTITQQLQTALRSNPSAATPLLSRAKVTLLKHNALLPTASSPPQHLLAAREILELGALLSIKQQDPDGFTRYFHSLQPFYQLPERVLPRRGSGASKITGLYLLLLLSQGDYAGFHTLLESLEVVAQSGAATGASASSLEDDQFIQYPVRLEQALMEGSYDRVWGETKGERVPSEEFSVFSNVLVATIRNEIASCSEKAYPSIPITDAKSLLFLDSEGAVIEFAKSRGWFGKDGRIYFPQQEQETLSQEKDVMQLSGQIIQNTLGYARELETIV